MHGIKINMMFQIGSQVCNGLYNMPMGLIKNGAGTWLSLYIKYIFTFNMMIVLCLLICLCCMLVPINRDIKVLLLLEYLS